MFVSSVRPIGERLTYVYELSATSIALEREKTTSVKALNDVEVRLSSRNMQMEFTISRQLASSLREEVESAWPVWVDDIYPERVTADHGGKARGPPVPVVKRATELNRVVPPAVLQGTHGPGS